MSIVGTIIRGTTPTIKYTFKKIDVEDITTAYLTILISGNIKIEKDISTATIENKYISWTLTQEETLSMTSNKVTCQLNWKLSNGTRGASKKTPLLVESNTKEVVI